MKYAIPTLLLFIFSGFLFSSPLALADYQLEFLDNDTNVNFGMQYHLAKNNFYFDSADNTNYPLLFKSDRQDDFYTINSEFNGCAFGLIGDSCLFSDSDNMFVSVVVDGYLRKYKLNLNDAIEGGGNTSYFSPDSISIYPPVISNNSIWAGGSIFGGVSSTPQNMLASVAAGLQETAVSIWPLFALVGIGLAFVIAGYLVNFIKLSVRGRRILKLKSDGDIDTLKREYKQDLDYAVGHRATRRVINDYNPAISALANKKDV